MAQSQDSAAVKDIFDLSLEELMNVKVVTASRTEQQLSEVPGVVTVITQEEIREQGFRTLRELLLTIPGFEMLQNDDEQIVAMRGVYGTTNQKILLLRDGLRMNEGLFDRSQIAEYAITLENVAQVEVIRGPGASLYGNAATTAVVNLITQKTNHTRASLLAGTAGQIGVELSMAKQISEKEGFSAFMRIYRNSGQRTEIPSEDDYAPDSLKQPGITYPEHYPLGIDAGFHYTKGILDAGMAYTYSDYRAYWGNQGQNINPDNIPINLGFESAMFHAEINLTPQFGEKWRTHFHHHFDYEDIAHLGKALLPASHYPPYGRLLEFSFLSARLGGNYFTTYQYEKGSLLFGAEYENRQYLQTYAWDNWQDPEKFRFTNEVLPPGNEWRGAAYMQWLYRFTHNLQINAGLRYDAAENFAPTLNPRLALIFAPAPKLSIKGIFARSFQAPGYFYRESNPLLGYGSTEALNAEIMESFQLATRYEFNKGFIEVMGFRNHMNNLIRRDGELYKNLGSMTAYGAELESKLHFFDRKLTTQVNFSYLVPESKGTDELYLNQNIHKGEFIVLSKYTAVAGVTARPHKKFTFNLNGRWRSSYFAYAVNSPEHIKMPSFLLLNTTLQALEVFSHTTFALSVHNLLNTEYRLGDPASPSPVLQPSRWIQLRIRYEL